MEPYYHACAFFNSAEEEYEVLAPFVAEGIEQGDKAVHVVAPDLGADHRRRLAEAGVDVDTAEQSGQLEVWSWEDVYLKGGRFDSDDQIARFEAAIDQARAQGFPRTRIIGHVGMGPR